MEIKLPRLKLEVREDEGFSLGKLSPTLIVGFGAHWAVCYTHLTLPTIYSV